jgi:hypothetical protein
VEDGVSVTADDIGSVVAQKPFTSSTCDICKRECKVGMQHTVRVLKRWVQWPGDRGGGGVMANLMKWRGLDPEEVLPPNSRSAHDAYTDITGLKRSWEDHDKVFFTYAITDGEYVKVGRADHINRRISSIQTGNPRELRLLGFVAADIEKAVHKRLKLAGLHAHREWFADLEETREILQSFGLLHMPQPKTDLGAEEHW